MTTCVLFIQGEGTDAHTEDASLADSLKRALGPTYDVRFPRMPAESDPVIDAIRTEGAADRDVIAYMPEVVQSSAPANKQAEDRRTSLLGCLYR